MPYFSLEPQSRRSFLLSSSAAIVCGVLIPKEVRSTDVQKKNSLEAISFAGPNVIQLIIRDTFLEIPSRIKVDHETRVSWQPEIRDNFGSQGYYGEIAGNFSGNRNQNAPQLFTPWPSVIQETRLEEFNSLNSKTGTSEADNTSFWKVTVDGKSARIINLYRKTVPIRSVAIGKREWANTKRHLLTFIIDQDVQVNSTIRVRSAAMLNIEVLRLKDMPSEAIHICQVGYPTIGPKKAYVGMWFGHDLNGTAGTTNGSLSEKTRWQLKTVKSRDPVLSGKLRLVLAAESPHQGDKNFNGCDMYVADFSGHSESGMYYIEVEGFGASLPFQIDPTPYAETLRLAARWYFRQRSGCSISEPFAEGIERPRNSHPDDGLEVWQTEISLRKVQRKGFHRALNDSKTLSKNSTAWGGWHDAGDWDRRIQHMEPVFQLANIVELFSSSRTLSLNLPETGKPFSHPQVLAKIDQDDIGDGSTVLPDLVHEALWGISLWRRTQNEQGAIIGGVEYSTSGTIGSVSWNPVQKIYAYAPDEWSSYWFVLGAAKLGHVISSICGDKVLGEKLLKEAMNAWKWAEKEFQARAHIDKLGDRDLTSIWRLRVLSSAVLYRATGEESAKNVFENHNPFRPKFKNGANNIRPNILPFASFEYVRAAREGRIFDSELKLAIENWVKWKTNPKRFTVADYGLQRKVEYPWGRGWLRFGPAGNWTANELALGYALDGKKTTVRRDLVTHGMWFAQGCNPSNVSLIQGLGLRQFSDPLNVDLEYGKTIPGQISFGVAGGELHPWEETKTAGSIYPNMQAAWPEYNQIYESSNIAICSEHGIRSIAMEWLIASAMVNEFGNSL